MGGTAAPQRSSSGMSARIAWHSATAIASSSSSSVITSYSIHYTKLYEGCRQLHGDIPSIGIVPMTDVREAVLGGEIFDRLVYEFFKVGPEHFFTDIFSAAALNSDYSCFFGELRNNFV